ncbi:HEPN domain-containing protein [Pseudomonas syringae]|uniref:HEPN domain-containing protein n=1 Tax=Pseudomonas syringae TaxID=317 RepID=UPI0011AED7C4|nr:HEPN domain-containing protein [Pseudomonas syringae]
MPNDFPKNLSDRHPNAHSPEDKLVNRATRVATRIEAQIIRFLKMSPSEIMKHIGTSRYSAFCTIRTPERREILIGLIGEKGFDELSEIITLFCPRLTGKTSHGALKTVMKAAFYEYIIQAKRSIEPQSIKDMLERAVVIVEAGHRKYLHHIPCIFFVEESPDVFYVGPVKFTRMESFVEGIGKELEPDDKEDGSEAVCNDEYYRRSLDYYREYSWVASVSIEKSDFEVSFKNAVFICDTALNVARVIFGRDRTKLIRLSTSQSEGLRSARIWHVDDTDIKCSLSSRAVSPPGPSNWYEYLNSDEGLGIKHVLGSVIEYSRVFMPHSELSSRLLDALSWFGDACLERSPAAAVVKYVTCIERLYFGSHQNGIKKRFSSRVAKILADFDCVGSSKVIDLAHQIYDVRSTLVHGALSPRAGEVDWPLGGAEQLARDCIFCACQLYVLILDAFHPETPEEFEDALVSYEVNGIDWCIDKVHRERVE